MQRVLIFKEKIGQIIGGIAFIDFDKSERQGLHN
jgi:hypothetical protein